MGLLEDDNEWIIALTKVSQYGTGKQIRACFAVILQYCSPSEPKKLYNKFLEDMSQDIIHEEMRLRNCLRGEINPQTFEDRLLTSIDDELAQMGGSLTDIERMPDPHPLTEDEKVSRLLKEEVYDKYEQAKMFQNDYTIMNGGQAKLFNLVLNSPGGYGKTFILKVIAAKIRSEGGIVLNVTSTGLAAQNLIGGRTAHNRFKIPIPIMEDSTCNIIAQLALVKMIKNTKLIIWDEIISVPWHNIECVERTLRDVMECEEPWADSTSGKKGERPQIVHSCIQFSPLYPNMKEHRLTVNMTDPQEMDFSSYQLRLGEGQEETHKEYGENMIRIPDQHLVQTSLRKFSQTLNMAVGSAENLISGAIYTPLNKNFHELNEHCLAKFPEEEKMYLSADFILENDHQEAIPPEYLNSITPSGLTVAASEMAPG